MKNPIETSLENMADICKTIMEKAVERGELTEADILFLSMYQKEKARATAVPLYRKLLGGLKEVTALIKQFTPAAETPLETDYTEVDTDAI